MTTVTIIEDATNVTIDDEIVYITPSTEQITVTIQDGVSASYVSQVIDDLIANLYVILQNILIAGDNITITPVGTTLVIAASGTVTPPIGNVGYATGFDWPFTYAD